MKIPTPIRAIGLAVKEVSTCTLIIAVLLGICLFIAEYPYFSLGILGVLIVAIAWIYYIGKVERADRIKAQQDKYPGWKE